MGTRAEIDVDDILKIILVLVVVWIGLEILGEFVDLVAGLLGPLQPILGLLIVLIIVLYLLDRL